MKVPRALQIFLCHSSKDKQAVRDLYHQLRADGFEPWLDEENLLAGQDWLQVIAREVSITDVVLVCLSRESINKKGIVQKEIKFAVDVAEKQPEDTIFLIPLRLEECNIPERLGHLHRVDLFKEKGYEHLKKALKHRASSLSKLAIGKPLGQGLSPKVGNTGGQFGYPSSTPPSLALGYFRLGLFDVAGRPVNETGVKVSFVRATENKVISTATNLDFPARARVPEHTFAVPAFPREQNLLCEVTAPRFRQCRSGIFTLTNQETIVSNLTLFRRPDKVSASFTEWNQLPSQFLSFKAALNKSSALKVKGGKTLGKFTETTYDGVTGEIELLAKAALLNLYTKLTDLIEPTAGNEPWFSFVQEIVEIGKERFIAIVDPRMGEIIRTIKGNFDKFKNYKPTPAQNHFGNIPAVYQVQKAKMFSIKSTEDHGNVQLTMAPGKDASGNDLLILDADIDENGQLLAHLADLFKHKFTGGTHPFDIHEYLSLDNPNRPLGYDLV